MNYSELINDFIDGRLAPDKEDELFLALSSDDELRSELKENLAIDQAMKDDAASLAPSAASTAAVFSRLGFDAPAPAPKKSTVQRFRDFIAPAQKYASHAIAGIASAGVAVALMWLLTGNQQDDESSGQAAYRADAVKGLPVAEVSPMQDNELDIIIMQGADAAIPKEQNEKAYREGYLAGSREASSVFGGRLANLEKELSRQNALFESLAADAMQNSGEISGRIIESQRLVTLPAASVPTRASQSFIYVPVDTSPGDNSNNLNLLNFEKIGVEAELRGSDYRMFPVAKMPESSIPEFNNSGLALFYNVSDDFQLGFDLRQEYFYQEYEGEIDGRRVRYMQHPNFVTYGAAARYKFLHLGDFTAFGELHAGFNKAGAVGRAGVGVKYSPTGDYNFLLGIEGSALAFKHETDPYLARKIGFYYGVAFNF